jgi:hypothetical protein
VDTLDIAQVARMGFILAHLMAFALAAVGIALGDIAIFRGQRVDAALLAQASRVVKAALIALWLSGALVVWLDTRFDPATLLAMPKLLAKLSVAVALTANGALLHLLVFPRLGDPAPATPHKLATWASMLGAVSLSSWLFAVFVGVGKPVASMLGYGGFMLVYAAVLGVAVAVSLATMRPLLAARLGVAVAGAQGSWIGPLLSITFGSRPSTPPPTANAAGSTLNLRQPPS